MNTYNPVGWFEIPVEDMDRAKTFYQSLFGVVLSNIPMPDYELWVFPMSDDHKGIGGGLMKGEHAYHPRQWGTVIYFTAPDLDKTLEMATSLGAQIILPKKDIGAWGEIAWIVDTEGNTIGLHKAKNQ